MKKLISILAIAGLAVVLAGCSSLKQTVLDPKTGEAVATYEYRGDMATAIVMDLKDKIVIISDDAMLIDIAIEPPTQDNPTGALHLKYLNGKHVYVTIPKDVDFENMDMKAIAKIIQASTGKDMKVTSSGLNAIAPEAVKK